jgi:hypothetical protein
MEDREDIADREDMEDEDEDEDEEEAEEENGRKKTEENGCGDTSGKRRTAEQEEVSGI